MARANAAHTFSGDIVPEWRAGAGASRRLFDEFYANLDFAWLTFPEVDVFQVVPGVTWRWHPRFTSEMKLYLARNEFDGLEATDSLTWVGNTTWQMARQSSAVNSGTGLMKPSPAKAKADPDAERSCMSAPLFRPTRRSYLGLWRF